ncbi:hypothetical protein [Novosphingobium sp.]|uniref:hypothetical protein n=1 Tax=Novosphingobium sp. TaxID=1874826 RepID=UPI0038BD9EF0
MLNTDRLRRWAREALARALYWQQHASIRLAFVAGLLASWATTYPDQWAGVVGMLPERLRPFAGLIVLYAATKARTMPQPGIKPKGGAQ